MKKVAVFPGTFDPFTIGHEDIVKRALLVFDEVIVAIGVNALKKNCFSVKDRIDMISKTFADEPRVTVDYYEGLTADYCHKHGAIAIIRGLRSSSDFESERSIAQMNRKISPDVDTYFIISSPENMPVASTIVRDIIHNGGDASQFVPKAVNLSDYKEQK